MCVNRRGVCPDCSASNLYWDACDDTSSPEHHLQLSRGVQRGGARSCRLHSGLDCTSTPAFTLAPTTVTLAPTLTPATTQTTTTTTTTASTPNITTSPSPSPRTMPATHYEMESAMAAVRLDTPVMQWAVVSW